ncbi:hypothetical protein FH972_023102 [Carpinus fangiana]|uniref:Uncharacterized protein n=1 Tax=Carpinus fangiana TaxID=176857 RepID=A0A5N6KU71_9ROSI|nr:hypothetical protein FH972_023102 [Carpinus fangiana]
MSTARSNIRVFVTFKESTVFAGEDVEATITFKNVEIKRPKPQRPGLAIVQANGTATPSVAPSQPSQPVSKAALSRAPSVASNVKKPAHLTASRHRPAISLNIVDSASTRPRGPGSTTGGVNIAEPSPGTPKHGRSVSIVSLGSEASRGERLRGSQPSHTPSRPGFKHGRSASVQVSSPSQRIGRSPSLSGRSTFASPLSGVASPRYRSAESYFLQRPDQNQGSLVETPPVLPSPRGQLQQGFQFPPASKRPLPHRNATISAIGHARSNTSSPRPSSPAVRESRDPTRLDSGHLNRVLSLSSEDGTPRSSGDFYSLSNRSDETLASEYQTQPSSRLLQRPPFSRSPSNLNPTPASKVPETLMMGYVQMSGSFVLDGSLVNPAPFEEVKRKAVVGGQGGGGVVGIEQKKSDGGLFGSFGWGNIGESLGGLLRGGEQSSIKEMKSIATSKSIPLLSTPKSILFVDLKLAPGQSRSYSYSFALPRGLPPSHRGRAIKVSYHLIIGTQRPSASKTQQIRQVEIPFRVFSGVNAEGDTLGHDLMTPYIILQDKAKTSSLDQLTAPIIREPAPPPSALASSSEIFEQDTSTVEQGGQEQKRQSPPPSPPRFPQFKCSPLRMQQLKRDSASSPCPASSADCASCASASCTCASSSSACAAA